MSVLIVEKSKLFTVPSAYRMRRGAEGCMRVVKRGPKDYTGKDIGENLSRATLKFF